MRIVTRPDFDGIVCAVLLFEAENIDQDIFWTEPNEVQKKKISVSPDDIMANLPYMPGCGMWFDHHVSNQPDLDFKGAFEIAPSAAGVIYTYYRDRGRLDSRFDELVKNTDVIDSASLNMDQVRCPEKYPYILLSMTIKNHEYSDTAYWNRLVNLLRSNDIDSVIGDPEVQKRCAAVIEENHVYEKHLMTYTKIENRISITDFRSLEDVPDGNRFLSYSLFPETIASVKIRYSRPDKKHVQISIGHSIFNRQCRVNVGKLLAEYGGGGHAGAGGCTLDADSAQENILEMLEVLFQNRKET